MEKFLFRDGTNGLKEVESKEELRSCIQSASDPSAIRIWIFQTSEWLSLEGFRRVYGDTVFPAGNPQPVTVAKQLPPAKKSTAKRPAITRWLGVIAGIAAIFLVYNFTRVAWAKAPATILVAARPANVPPVNADSVILAIENLRGQKLDKVTKTNLRIRNTWPDLVTLTLQSDRDSSDHGNRYYHISFVVDNATGYTLDQVVGEWKVWKAGEAIHTDTVQFNTVGYTAPGQRYAEGIYRGDSLTLSFLSLKARSFNFCYSADKKSNYGNYNDRWYCR